MAKTDKPFTIHFVCRGNVFRSRLAAAYFHTLAGQRFVITSSGVATQDTETQTFSPLAVPTARLHGLTYGVSGRKRQTTDQLLEDADVIIFMSRDVYDVALKLYHFDVRKCQVWHVPDFNLHKMNQLLALHDDKALVDAVAGRFLNIQRKCDELYDYLTRAAWLDVVDAANKPAGLRLPITWITDRGLWHRGVHVVAQTTDGKYVVEKRSKQIVFAPGMLEVSLGGGVDTGEQPLRAAARETHEELGVHVPEKEFRPLFTCKQVGYHPHYRKQTKCHLYVYSVKLPVHSTELRPQLSEVAEILTLSKRQVKRLLRKHRLRHLGQLTWSYKLHSKAVAYSSLEV